MSLRKCTGCGLEAISPEDLELFKKKKTSPHGRVNLCKKCEYQQAKARETKEAREIRLARNAQFRKDNPDHVKQWKQDNREQWLVTHANYQAKRRAAKKQAVPKWFDKEEVAYIYNLAKERNLEVDHIIPLTHDKVCGLHVQENLRCIPKELNMWKSNKLLNGVSNNSMGGSR
jgi:hypothetical protein